MDERTQALPRALARVPGGRRGLTSVLAVGVAAAVVASCGQLGNQSGARATTSAALPRETRLAPEHPHAASLPTPKRPNLLVIETDDMRADDLRFMPHVRRLIQQRG